MVSYIWVVVSVVQGTDAELGVQVFDYEPTEQQLAEHAAIMGEGITTRVVRTFIGCELVQAHI